MQGRYARILEFLGSKPELYAQSTAPFWDDEHISKQMLDAHLNPDIDAASRNHAFIDQSVRWLASLFREDRAGLADAPGAARLLDLGCGPGVYAEKLTRAGFSVTGVDFSRRSVAYAKDSAEAQKLDIQYRYMNYLALDYEREFDAAIMIYCDFGVLSPRDRATLLTNVYRALKPGGRFVFDVNTKECLADYREGRAAAFSESGFWSAGPHVCIESNYRYPETDNYLDQYVVITDDKCECYNIWNQIHDKDTVRAELEGAGFAVESYYDDVAGKPLSDSAKTLCVVAAKGAERSKAK